MSPALSARAIVVVAVFLLLLSFAVYGNALGNPFQIDDPTVIENDIRVRQCHIGELLTGNYRLPPYQDLLYRPLVKISFALNWVLSREAWAFRVPNVVLHAATALVVFLLAWDLFRERLGPRATWAAVVAGVVFVVHPIHSECLNSIVGRADEFDVLDQLVVEGIEAWCGDLERLQPAGSVGRDGDHDGVVRDQLGDQAANFLRGVRVADMDHEGSVAKRAEVELFFDWLHRARATCTQPSPILQIGRQPPKTATP